MTVIEAIYENGVLKPLAGSSQLKEQQHYKLIVEEEPHAFSGEDSDLNPEFFDELERRTTILADGRKIVRLEGIFEKFLQETHDGERIMDETLEELRHERNTLIQAELDEYFPLRESK